MEASPAFNPNEPEKPCECEAGDCRCQDEYEIKPSDSGKFYIYHHGIMVQGPMSKHDAEQWLDAVRGNEG